MSEYYNMKSEEVSVAQYDITMGHVKAISAATIDPKRVLSSLAGCFSDTAAN